MYHNRVVEKVCSAGLHFSSAWTSLSSNRSYISHLLTLSIGVTRLHNHSYARQSFLVVWGDILTIHMSFNCVGPSGVVLCVYMRPWSRDEMMISASIILEDHFLLIN
jgi:uncharacterized membrane protein YedE/YeeE